MKILLSFLRILILTTLFAILLGGGGLYFAINRPELQGHVTAFINNEFLAKLQMQAEIQSVEVSVFPPGISLRNVRLSRVAQEAQCYGAPCLAEISIGAIDVSIALLESWHRSTPVVGDVQVSSGIAHFDFSDTGEIVLPLQLPKSQNDVNTTLLPLETWRSLREILPALVRISNFKIELGRVVGKSEQPGFEGNIRSFLWRNKGANNKDLLDAVFDNIRVSVPQDDLTKPIPRTSVDEIAINATIDDAGEVDFRQLRTRGKSIEAEAQGTFAFTNDAAKFPGTLRAKGTASFAEILPLIGLTASGRTKFDAQISIAERTGEVSGKTSLEWSSDSRLAGYALYKGKSSIKYQKNHLEVDALDIETSNGGKLSGLGRVDFLGDDVAANVAGKVENMSFMELMKGLDVSTDAVEFRANSQDLQVRVDVKNGGEKFGIEVSGPLEVRNLIVPSLHTNTRTPLPTCKGRLDLFSDYDHLQMKNTTLSCNNDDDGRVAVLEGLVDYNSGKVNFDLEGKNVDFSLSEYFLMDNQRFFSEMPTTGKVNIKGSIISKNSKDSVSFVSHLDGRNMRLYGVEYQTLEGDLSITDKGVFGKNLKGSLGEKQDTLIDMNHFFVLFDDEVHSEFAGKVSGSIRSGLLATQKLHKLEESEKNPFLGTIREGTITVRGPFSPHTVPNLPAPESLIAVRDSLNSLLNWDIDASISAAGISIENFEIPKITTRINCQKGLCSKSNLRSEGPYLRGHNKESGYTVLDINEFSTLGAKINLRAANLPIGTLSGPENLKGNLSISSAISGTWSRLATDTRINLNNLIVGTNSYGDSQAFINSNGKNDLEVRLEALSGRLRARGVFPHNLIGPSKVFLTLDSIDPTKLLSPEVRSEYNLLSALDGTATLEGPAPFSHTQRNMPWYDQWSATGLINNAKVQIQSILFALVNPIRFSFQHNLLKVEPFQIADVSANGSKSLLKGTAQFNTKTYALVTSTDVQLDLNSLQNVFPQIGKSQGSLGLSLRVEGKYPDLNWKGSGALSNGALLLNSFPPAIRDLEIDFGFNNNQVLLNTVSGKKGEGTFFINGILDWSKMISEDDFLPAIRVSASLDRLQSRFPIPILQALDAELSAELTFCRRLDCGNNVAASRPSGSTKDILLISGDAVVRDARITRALECAAIASALSNQNQSRPTESVEKFLSAIRLDISVEAPGTITFDSKCARTHLKAQKTQIQGPLSNPSIFGHLETSDSSGSGKVGNITFNIEKASIDFDGAYNNPRYDLLLTTTVAGYREDRQRIDYKIFIRLEDRPFNSERAQPEVRAEPPVHPDGRRMLSQTDLVAMLVTGRGPDASSPSSLSTELIANEFATAGTSAIFSEARLESSVSRMLNRLSAGIVDRVIIDPLFDAGRPKFRIRTVMEPVEKVNVNLETDQDPAGTSASAKNATLNAQWLLNNRINLGLDFHIKDENTGTPLSMGTGIMFKFGGD
jgi:hypothetical protein